MNHKRMKRVASAALAATALFTSFATTTAKEQHIVCPSEIAARQITVAASAGWTGLYRPNSKASLRAARVWVGPLNEGPGELMGEIVRGKDGTTINRFPSLDLAPLVGGVRVPQDKWIVCTYGDEGIVQAMKLPADTRECDVVYRRVQDPLDRRSRPVEVLSDIVCR